MHTFLIVFFPRSSHWIHQARRTCGASGVDKAIGTLLYSMASRLKDPKRVAFLSDAIVQGKICTELQLAGNP